MEEVVRLARALQRELLDQHLDFSGLGQADDLHEFGDRAPVGGGDGAFFRRALEVHRQRAAAETHNRYMAEDPGDNTQGRTLSETKENLKDALALILETNRLLI